MRNKIIIGGLVLAVLVGGALAFLNRQPDVPFDKNWAQGIIREIVAKDENGGDYAAYLYPKVLKKGDRIADWDEESAQTKISKPVYFAWIDREPGNAFFAHPTRFVLIDAQSGEYEVSDKTYWPVVNGESFEGDAATEVGESPAARNSRTDRMLSGMRSYLYESVSRITPLSAHASGGQRLRIDPELRNAPPGEYYAVIVAGFGRNAWVFMEGAHQMYDALKEAGYSDTNITFLAQAPAKLDPAWNRQGDPVLVRSDAVDGGSSPDAFAETLAALQQRMTKRDSLYVFMLTHGDRGKFVLGRPAGTTEDVATALRGRSANLASARFADVLVRRTNALCELMIEIDSCHAGTHEQKLREAYDPERITRMEVAHSSTESQISYGADYRNPLQAARTAREDLDAAARNTPVADTNPTDRGGEFSSGFIASIGETVFSAINESAMDLDAANANNLTDPYYWRLGNTGPCFTEGSAIAASATPVPSPTRLATPSPAATPTPTPPPTAAPQQVSTSMTFDHVKPGEYSEVRLVVMAAPGASVAAKLTGPGVASAADMSAKATAAGKATFTWKIVSFGTYKAAGTADGAAFNASVVVK